jgi:hypothetical protein
LVVVVDHLKTDLGLGICPGDLGEGLALRTGHPIPCLRKKGAFAYFGCLLCWPFACDLRLEVERGRRARLCLVHPTLREKYSSSCGGHTLEPLPAEIWSALFGHLPCRKISPLAHPPFQTAALQIVTKRGIGLPIVTCKRHTIITHVEKGSVASGKSFSFQALATAKDRGWETSDQRA